MGGKGVYLVRFQVPSALSVEVNGKSVPMEEFLQTHDPSQVTNLVHIPHGGKELTVVGLMIAEETPAPARAKRLKSYALSKSRGGGEREILKVFK